MIGLVIAAALLSAGAAALIVQRAARGAQRRGETKPELTIYRRQMAEIDALADRGLIADAERRTVRAETGRRLLAAAGRAEGPLRAARPQLVLALAALAPLVAVGAYLAVGAPGFGDQPFAKRLAAWRAADPETLSAPQMAAILRAVSAERPADPEPLRNLAIAELASDQPMEAVQALQRAIALAPRRADLWDALGQAQVAKADGDVGEDAQRAFRQALALDPQEVGARYYLARARIAGGDVAGGLAQWRAIEGGLAPDDPRKAQLAAEIQQVASAGALAPEAPPQAAQAGAAPQVGAPQIQAMVDGLAAQLKANPDNPAGWVQLVRAYSVLGESDRRDAALAEARRRYAGKADVLAALDAATRPQR